MDIQNRFVGFCASTVDDEREILVKPADLAATLLLFEDYVFESCKLLEFPQLVSIFGFDSVLELVKSRSIKIKCDAIFPVSGPISFINRSMPSAFQHEERKRKPELEMSSSASDGK
jgi:hypothetical protein